MSQQGTSQSPFGGNTEEALSRVAARQLPAQQAAFFSYVADMVRQGLNARLGFVLLTPDHQPESAEYAALSITTREGDRRRSTDFPAMIVPEMLSGRPVQQCNLEHRLPNHPLVSRHQLKRMSAVAVDTGSGPATLYIGVARRANSEHKDDQALQWLAERLNGLLSTSILSPAIRSVTSGQLKERYRDAQLAIAVTDLAGRLLYVSPGFCHLLDQPAHRLLFDERRRSEPWIADNDLRALIAAPEAGKTAVRITSLRRGDGDLLTVMARLGSLNLDDQEAIQIECLQTADHSEALLQPLALALLDEPVLYFRRNPTRIVHANTAACRYFGFQPHQFCGLDTPLSILFDGAEALEDGAAMAQLTQQGHLKLDVFARRAGGDREQRKLLLAAASYYDDEPAEQWVLICQQGDDHRRLGRRLHLLEEALDTSTDGMALANRNLRVVHHNSALSDLFRCWGGKSLIGRRLESLLSPFEQDMVTGEILPTLRKRGQWQGELTGRRMDQSEFPQSMHIRWLDSGDSVITVRDLTSNQVQLRRLEQAERKYRELFDNAPHGMYQTAPSGRILSANRALSRLLGYVDTEQLISQVNDVARQLYVDPDMRRLLLRKLIKHGYYRNQVFALRCADASEVWVSEDAHVICDETGKIRYFEGTLVDITEQHSAERALKASEHKFRQLIENAHDGVAVLVNNTIRYANRALAHLCRKPREQIIGSSFAELLTADQQMRLSPRHPDAINLNQEQSGLVTVLDAGKEPPVDVFLRMVKIEFEGEAAISVSMRDITEQRRTEAEMRRYAFSDTLTQLPNREGILRRIDEALRQRRPNHQTALLFLDLDGFKLVNDGLGHSLGDELLIALADRLRASVGEHDLVGRYGGDEFILLLTDLDSTTDAEQVARRILRSLRNPFQLSDTTVYTNASIGIDVDVDGRRTTPDLLRNADIAMYRAKRSGKGRFVLFNKDMQRVARRRLTLENELRQAVDERQFRLYYQPIVDLSSRTLQGFESLLRWEHPERGIIAPGDFLDVAEETGVMDAISRYVTRDALAQLATWHKAWPDYADLSISINISNRQFASRELPDQIRRTLLGAGVNPARIHLEITEKVFMDDPDFAHQTFETLKGLGVQLLMDDFGTGFSSLSALRRLPIDILKIDRAFVRNVAVDQRDLAVIRTIIQLAKELKMRVIAEGIEDAEQARIMRELGCELGQGYLFGAAAPPEIAEERLRKRRL